MLLSIWESIGQCSILCARYAAKIIRRQFNLRTDFTSAHAEKNNCINIFQDIDPQYNKDALDVTVKCVIEISILEVLAALIVSLFSYKEKYGDKSE